MECLIGITGKDFVLMASDNLAAHSIIAIKHDTQKQFELSDKMVCFLLFLNFYFFLNSDHTNKLCKFSFLR